MGGRGEGEGEARGGGGASEKKKKKKTLGARASFPKCPFRAPLAQSNTQVHHPLATKWVAVVYFSVHGEA